jgi:hypothetical protein
VIENHLFRVVALLAMAVRTVAMSGTAPLFRDAVPTGGLAPVRS